MAEKMAEKGEVSSLTKGVEGMFKRPRIYHANLYGDKLEIHPKPNDLLYVRTCLNCKFTVKDRLAKCIIEGSKNCWVNFEDVLMAGTVEIIRSENTMISINPADPLQTVLAEHCKDVHLYYYEPHAVGNIYTVHCDNVVIHLQPPHRRLTVLDVPVNSSEQYVSTLFLDDVFTSKVLREGNGYVTTAEKLKTADSKEQDILRKLEEHFKDLFKVVPKEGAESAAEGGTEETDGGGDKEGGGAEGGGASFGSVEDALKQIMSKLVPSQAVVHDKTVEGAGDVPAIKEAEDKKEFFDSEEELTRKLDLAAAWAKESKHIIVFTGAGVSTSSGIPDYRSGMNTVLETGPGLWERQAHGERPTRKAFALSKALPSPTHMAIVKMHKEGLVKMTVSQNIDGLHRRSGLGPSQLAELHGNTNLETCRKCKRQYLRDFETREAAQSYDHKTSRRCDDPNCRGALNDSIINFGEGLPSGELKKAMEHAEKVDAHIYPLERAMKLKFAPFVVFEKSFSMADLCIVLGSSLRVKPACTVPEVVEEHGGRVVLCNLQKLPRFPEGEKVVQVFSKCDEFMSALMDRLSLEIPTFVLQRRARFTLQEKDGATEITVMGLDVDEELPYSFIQEVKIEHEGKLYESDSEPHVLTLPAGTTGPLLVELHFHGHYGEAPLQVQVKESKVFRLGYTVQQGAWEVNEEKTNE